MVLTALAVFDLDDTLIDTSSTLVPLALAAVARAADVSTEQLNAQGKKIDEILMHVKGLTESQRAAAAAAYYDPDVPPLEPLPGARAMLETLHGRIHLALLTRGDPARQQNKIESSGLAPLFESIRIRAIEGSGSKADDLRALLDEFATTPERTVVIGDDPRDELHHAQELGCPTLLVPGVSLDEIPRVLERMGLLAPQC